MSASCCEVCGYDDWGFYAIISIIFSFEEEIILSYSLFLIPYSAIESDLSAIELVF